MVGFTVVLFLVVALHASLCCVLLCLIGTLYVLQANFSPHSVMKFCSSSDVWWGFSLVSCLSLLSPEVSGWMVLRCD